MITEIGAVKVRGGEVLGEFQTLVNPHTEIPPFIAVLTGITNSMVADAPPIESALPAFLEFAAGCVLVAHNAPFDVGFLQHFAAQQGRPWPRFEVLDTAKLARRVITRDDAPNCKLSSLALVFHSATTPNHRALSDARATVDVLHGLMERLGGLGVHTLEELQTFSLAGQHRRSAASATSPRASPTPPASTSSATTARRVLYVGTSRDLRTRVRSYFTASETRSRMGEMVGLADVGHRHRVRHAARGRGARAAADRRAQAALQPALPVPREGPLPQAHPRGVAAAVAGAPGARRRRRLPRPVLVAQDRREVPGRAPRDLPGPAVLRPAGAARRPAPPCVLAEMGRCLSPCDGSVDATTYAAVVRQLRDTLLRRPDEVVEAINQPDGPARRPTSGSRRPASTATGWPPSSGPPPAPSGSSALTRCPEIVAARREDDGRWAVHVVRHGRLAAAGVIPPRRRRPRSTSPSCARRAETVRRRARPGAGRDRRGVREDPALAGVPGRPAGRRRRRVDLPGRAARPATSRSTTRSTSPGSRWCPSTTRRDLTTVAPAGPLTRDTCPHDHRHRVRQGRRRPHPRGRRGDRRPRRRQRGLLRDRPDRPDRAGAGANHEDVADVVADRLNKVPGVTSTETHIAFRTYSQHDLESAFSLGLD